MSDPHVRPPGSLDEQDTRRGEVSEPGARLQARPTSTPSRRPNMQVRTGQPGSLTSSSGGSSVTKEALGRDDAIVRSRLLAAGYGKSGEVYRAFDRLVAALVAATARAEQQERVATDWRHHSGRTAGQYRAAEARAAELETALTEAKQRLAFFGCTCPTPLVCSRTCARLGGAGGASSTGTETQR